jgi:pimeloyl-ACP methyl ester carboxylesterase
MYYEYNNIKIYYEKYGNKNKSILILPGWGNTRNTFTNIINYFKEDYTIYIVDYPGFGNSPIHNKELTIYDYAELIYNFIKDLNINLPIIIAHSFGGRITSILLGKYNLKIDKLVLIDVAGIKRRKKLKIYLKEKIYKILKKLNKFLPVIKREIYLQKLGMYFSSSDYKNIPNSMKKTFQNIIKEDLRKYYKEIKVETLIIWGDKDTDTPLKDAIYLNKIISNSATIIYENSNHFSYLNYPYLTNQILSNFFN